MNKVTVGLINSTATVYEQYWYSTVTVLMSLPFCKTREMKKKKKKLKRGRRRNIQPNPNGTIVFKVNKLCWPELPTDRRVLMDSFLKIAGF